MSPVGASLTAEITCLMRASDQLRPSGGRILDDPYAELFLGWPLRRVHRGLRALGWPLRDPVGMTTYVLARHRFIDDCLQAAVTGGRIEQVVVLGAGYDTRAFRLARDLGDVRFFEVDFPATSARKRSVVEANTGRLPAARLDLVAIDLQTESLVDRLASAGLGAEAATFFIWEGVSMYLTSEAVCATLRDLRRLAAVGSELAVEFWYPASGLGLTASANRIGTRALQLIAEPPRFSIRPAEAPRLLAQTGFDLLEIAGADQLAARYVRDGRRLWQSNYMAHAVVGEAGAAARRQAC